MMPTNRLVPWSPLSAFQRDAGRLMGEMLDLLESGRGLRAGGFPALSLWEDSESLYAEAEVPGLRMEDLEIFVVGNELTVKGRRPPLEEKNVTYHRQERGTGEFARVLTLPMEVNAERVEATLRNGVLTVLMPKAEQARARKIAVKSA